MPQTTINRSQLQDYSLKVSEILLKKFPKDKEYITGEEIKSFCPVKQINFFIFNVIFLDWNEGINTHKSKWFSYDPVEVQTALNNLMNVLSHHIQIKKNDFDVLLKKSVADTLELLFYPIDFLLNFIQKNNFSTQELVHQLRFIHIHKDSINSWIDKIRKNSKNEQQVTRAEAKVFLESVFENNLVAHEELVLKYLEPLSQICPINFISSVKEPEEKILAFQKENNVLDNEGNKTETKVSQSLNEKFRSSTTTLNETLKGINEGSALNDKIRLSKIQDISSAISINQKFIFVKEFFGGKTDIYEE